MGELGAFLRVGRLPTPQRDPAKRTADYDEIYQVLGAEQAGEEGARCMDCGVPFCHNGCPLGNLIPDWNDLVYRGRWREALDSLHATSDFPEMTARICPAPCESACVLAINDDPVGIKNIEFAIIDRGWQEGWITPHPPEQRTGRTVGVIGGGPAGLVAATRLNQAGHSVVVYERDEGLGGLVRFGVPDFKLAKDVIDQRCAVFEAEGVEFRCNVDVGRDIDAEELCARHDALVVAIGSRVHRPLPIGGMELRGVRYAMDYLYARNRWVARGGSPAPEDDPELTAEGKHVVVIGGGDTAMDCAANAHREHAASVTVLDTYPEPTTSHARDYVPWPEAPKRVQHTYAMDEGGERKWTQTATEVLGQDGHVAGVRGSQVGPRPDYAPVPGTEFELPADLVLVAIGFSGPERNGVIEPLGLELDRRGNIAAPRFESSRTGVFAAGDARFGQSLVVTAMAEGRKVARMVERHLASVPVA